MRRKTLRERADIAATRKHGYPIMAYDGPMPCESNEVLFSYGDGWLAGYRAAMRDKRRGKRLKEEGLI